MENAAFDKIFDTSLHFVANQFQKNDVSHDIGHINRVVRLATSIAQSEIPKLSQETLQTIQLAALLHDVGDHKYVTKKEESMECLVGNFLRNEIQMDESKIQQIIIIIQNVSFTNELKNPLQLVISCKDPHTLLMAKIVQDADRLDAMGAIGIARVFSYGGARSRTIYSKTNDGKVLHRFYKHLPTVIEYLDPTQQNTQFPKTTICHFFEKLLHLKDRMKTSTGKELARARHQAMEQFLNDFYTEMDYINMVL